MKKNKKEERKEKRRSSMREAADREKDQREASRSSTRGRYDVGDDREQYKPVKGTAHIDIIPYRVSVKNHPLGLKVGSLYFRKRVFVHFNVGVEERSIICPKMTPGVGGRCFVCEQYLQMRKDPDAEEEVVRNLKPKERELYNIRDVNDEEKGVQFMDISRYNFGELLDEEWASKVEEDGDEGHFADPEGGSTVKVRFKEKKLGRNKFVAASSISFEERDDLDDSLVEKAVDLDACLNVLSYEEIEKLFLEDSGGDKDEDEEKEEEESDDDDEDEEEEDDDDEEEEEEEEEKPKKKAKSVKGKKKKKDDDDEDDVPF